jgi:hypothetical protein
MSVCWCDTSEKAVEGASESGRLERSIADGWKDLKICRRFFGSQKHHHVDDRPRAPQTLVKTKAPSTVRRAYTHQMGVVVTPTVPSVAARPMGRATLRPARSPTRSAVATRALPPANEIAGFVIGAGLIGLVFAASRLDGVIADAQVRGFEKDKDERWKKSKSASGGGNVFILPDDDDSK